MVKRIVGAICAMGLLLGLSGCAFQPVDLAGEWVYENPAGAGAARISIEPDGTFDITGWPSNLQIGGRDRKTREDDLNWDDPLSFTGELLGGTTVENSSGGGVSFILPKDVEEFGFSAYLFKGCDFVFFGCRNELYFYLTNLNDERNYVVFVQQSE